MSSASIWFAELVEKLAALVPPPRFNLVRYGGILALGARWRPLVIPIDTDAIDLAQALDTTPEFWLNLQQAWDLNQAYRLRRAS